MTTRYGFTVHQEAGNQTYRHMYVTIYLRGERNTYSPHGEFYWTRIAQLNWQTDNSVDYWYGVRLEASLEYRSNFDAFTKFCQKVQKADVYDTDGQSFLEWMAAEKFTPLCYDDRTNNIITAAEFEATRGMSLYKMMYTDYNGNKNYYEGFLAHSLADAQVAAFNWCARYKPDFLEVWNTKVEIV